MRKIEFLTHSAADLHLGGGALQLGADDAHGHGARGRDLPGGQRRGVQHLQEQDGGGQVQLQGAQPAHLPGHHQLITSVICGDYNPLLYVAGCVLCHRLSQIPRVRR